MYLARREFGGPLFVYRNCGAERTPRAWIFHATNERGIASSAAVNAGTVPGAAATGHTRSEAVSNLHLIEEAAAHA